MNAPRVVSLYSGAGGMDLGFVMAGFRPVFSNDIDHHAVASYKDWMARARKTMPHLREGRHRTTVGDISDTASLPGKGDAEVVIGGPPCQGFSVAGKMDPNDIRSRHVWNFLTVVERVQPRAFVMENVKALAENSRWAGLKRDLILRAESMDYATSLHVLNASHYGVPQGRERMFLIGVKKPETAMPGPTPITESAPPPLRVALNSLPSWGETGNNTICAAKITPAKSPVLRRSPYAGMLFNGQGRPMNLDAPAPTLPASMGGNRTPIVDQKQLNDKDVSWVVNYHKRLMGGDPPLREVPSHLRRITVEEAASIQTFPPLMHWHGPQSARFRQIGNAVPPILAYNVAMALRQWLDLPEFRPSRKLLGLRLPATLPLRSSVEYTASEKGMDSIEVPLTFPEFDFNTERAVQFV